MHGLVWAGLRTDRFEETVRFFRDVLGLPVDVPRPDFAIARMPNSSMLEIFGPGDDEHDHFATGPVPEFLVDDLDAAAEELRAAGVEVWGPYREQDYGGWLHFRAPDGTVWGVTSSPSYRRS